MTQLRVSILMLLTLTVILLGTGSCQPGAESAPPSSQPPYYSEATFMPQWLDGEAVPDSFHQIPTFSLTNQLGDPVTEATVAGKVFVVDFFFTACPGICPRMTDNMSLVQQAFADDDGVLLLSHSVTPEYDSVAVLQRYAEEKGVIAGKWHLLTGNRDEIYSLGRNAYFVEEDLGLEKAPYDFIHTENFVVVDQQRHIRGIYNGLDPAAIGQLIADVRTLIAAGVPSAPDSPIVSSAQ